MDVRIVIILAAVFGLSACDDQSGFVSEDEVHEIASDYAASAASTVQSDLTSEIEDLESRIDDLETENSRLQDRVNYLESAQYNPLLGH